MENNNDNKMTIYDYEEKYSKRENTRQISLVLKLVISLIGILIFAAFALVSLKIYDINKYVGYGSMMLFFIAYIFLYIVPVVKIHSLEAFEVNVNAMNAREAKRHNKELRNKISDKMIEITSECEGIGWYQSEKIEKLSLARKNNDNESVKNILTDIYENDVDKKSKDMILKSAVKSGFTSALSQSGTYDTILVTTINLQLIKDIVYLYGFRPTDAKLAKIYKSVLAGAISAYGMNNLKFGDSVAKGLSKYTKGVPIVGTAISTVTDSVIQGSTNAILTSVIGYQTKKYLYKEYRLQDILDNIELKDDTEDLNETIEEAKLGLKEAAKEAYKPDKEPLKSKTA